MIKAGENNGILNFEKQQEDGVFIEIVSLFGLLSVEFASINLPEK
jgi:hypothetical protein